MKIPALLSFFCISIFSFPDLGKAETIHCRIDQKAGISIFILSTDECLLKASGAIYLAEPVLQEYSNFRLDPDCKRKSIEYRVRKVGVESISVRDVLRDDYIGSHFFLSGKNVSETICSPMLLKEKDVSVVRVGIRESDSYTGYLTELLNTPFIWIPERSDGIHQSDAGIGSDCIAFAVYGIRRMGKQLPYMHPYRIEHFVDNVSPGILVSQKGIYYDADGASFRIDTVRQGDILYFKSHVAIFYADKGIQGVLDKDDLVIHSIGTGPHFSTIEHCRYYHLPLKILRWKFLH